MNIPSSFHRPSWWSVVGMLMLGSLLLLYTYEFFHQTNQADDAYISYRYAQKLVEGHGLVFNVGERVEGYTNLLWTLLVAAGIALGVSAPVVGHWLGFTSGVLLLLATWFYGRSLLPAEKKWLALAGPILLYASNSFAYWTPSGLEAPLYATMVTAALTAFAINRMNWVLVFCVLATLTRPEGALLAALLLGFDWIRQIFLERPRQMLVLLRLSLHCLGYALFIVGLTSFRVFYYGDFLPNTFYAKTGNLPWFYGPAYIYRTLVDGALFLLIPALIALRWKAYRIGFAYFALTMVYLVAVGGDFFLHGRFMLPVLPILIVGALVGINEVARVSTRVALAFAMVLPAFVLCSLYSLGPLWPRNPDFPATLEIAAKLPFSAKRESMKGRYNLASDELIKSQVYKLRSLDPPAQLVAAIGIGRLGYFGGEIPILDMVGLIDRHIARSDKQMDGVSLIPGHQKSDASYVLSRRPDVVFIPKSVESSWIPSMVSLHHEPRFSQEYLWDDELKAYVRRAELRR
jgi:arabinofuranosyltransferase